MRALLLVVTAILGLLSHTDAVNAAVLQYKSVLSGAAEAPPNPSPGTGSAMLTVDTVGHTFLLEFDFADLLGTTTVAHIHGPTENAGTGTAGVMTQTPSFAAFPVGVTGGIFNDTYDMTEAATWNPSFVNFWGSVADAETAFLASLSSGKAYLNIHTSMYGGGEIRGFFAAVAPVPLPAGLLLSLSALAILGAAGLRRRNSV